MRWETIEVMGAAHYMEQGFVVCRPIVQSPGYDFIIERDEKCYRVNVKKAGIRNKDRPYGWSINGSSKHTNCDIYLAWVPPLEKFIELPGDFFDGVKSKNRNIPKELIYGDN
jgi:hypothetical protein